MNTVVPLSIALVTVTVLLALRTPIYIALNFSLTALYSERGLRVNSESLHEHCTRY